MNAVSSAHRTGAGRPRNGNTKLTTGNMTRNIIVGNARADITHGPGPLLPDPLGPVDDSCAHPSLEATGRCGNDGIPAYPLPRRFQPPGLSCVVDGVLQRLLGR